MRPTLVDSATLCGVLADALQLVQAADSMEGTITWEQVAPADADGAFAVRAVYRTGSSMGQGGVSLLGDNDGAQPSDAWWPLRELMEALTRQRLCVDCHGTGTMHKQRGVGGGISTVAERCYCQDALEEAYRKANDVLQRQRAYLAEMQAKGIDTAA